MNLSGAETLFSLACFLFLAGALSALCFSKLHRTANVISGLFCMAGSAAGAGSVLFFLLKGSQITDVFLYHTGIPLLSIQLQYDRLSAYFLLILFVLTFAVSLYSIGYISHYYGKRSVGVFSFLYCLFVLTMIAVLLAANLPTFFIAWELMSAVSYFLVVFEHEKNETTKAGTVYIIMTHLGAAFLLAAFLIMYAWSGELPVIGADGAYAVLPQAAKNICFLFLLIGFGTKAGVIPFHIWLPKAHPAAASNVSALMSGFMIKTAVYGLLRFILTCFGGQTAWWGTAILIFGILAAVLGVAYALMEHNIKRLLAYHSIENIGIIFIGLGIGLLAYARGYDFIAGTALAAALFHTLNHALFKGGLFLGAGAIQFSAHTKDIEQLGGLIKRMPLTALCVLCFSLAISAIVPFNGFVSEWLTYQSLFAFIQNGTLGISLLAVVAAAALAFAGALAAVCFVKLFGISFLGLPRSEQAEAAREVPASMTGGMGILAILCLAFGLFPRGILAVLEPVLKDLAGLTVTGHLARGSFLPTFQGLEFSENRMSMLALLLVLLILVITAMIGIRLAGGAAGTRRYGTWDCGFEAINERMQYSATGFSKPLRIVFRILYRPARKLVLSGEHAPYFPDKMEYKVSTVSVFEKYIYDVIVQGLQRFSRRVKFSVQSGSLPMYLSYLLAVILLLMLYSRLF